MIGNANGKEHSSSHTAEHKPDDDSAIFDVEHVVPHSSPMSLLDRISEWSEGQLQAEVTIRPDTPFADDAGIPGWVGLEYMAQAIAAFAGCRARSQHERVAIGFLVGTRRFDCSVPYFPIGATLLITVDELISGDNSLSVFQCTLQGLGEHAQIKASANLNVFQPDDPEAFLQGQSRD
jgi:predicted hotdog family 3-hydroxylacyl-ACP dehydratase